MTLKMYRVTLVTEIKVELEAESEAEALEEARSYYPQDASEYTVVDEIVEELYGDNDE